MGAVLLTAAVLDACSGEGGSRGTASLVAGSPSDTVRIAGGLIAGTRGDDRSIREFRGIPYAAPPVGDLRWRPPRPSASWEGVRSAREFAPACMQDPPPEGSFYQIEFYDPPQPISEDCLYLNVWAPAKDAAPTRPVMVWVHGGAFSQGSGSMPSFDGEALARRGIVLITFNYRLGVFGLLAHPGLSREVRIGTSGNYGLLDHVAALEWVRDNAAAFGGDPGNVTVFGQSSGADNVNLLLVAPAARGLFHRAILQSGSAFAFGRKGTLAEAATRGAAFADSVADGTIDSLRALAADTLLARARGFAFRPNIDGRLIPREVDRLIAEGEQAAVPLLAGSTSNEGTTLFGPGLTADRYRELVDRGYGADADAFLRLWPAGSDEEAKRSFDESFADEIAWGAQTLAERHAASATAPAFVYLFGGVPPGRNPDRYGAFHSSEIVYVFGSLDSVDRPWTDEDRALSELLVSYWTNFARSGNPNGPGLARWPVFDERRLVMELDPTPGALTVLDDDERRFLERRWSR